MDPPALVKTFKYNNPSSQQTMFSSVQEPHCRSSYPQQSNNNSGFEDLSFSSYVKAKDPSQKPQGNDTNCTNDDAEISIFDAQKYFSENSDPKDGKRQDQMIPHDHTLSLPRLSSVSSVDGYGRNFRTRSFHATPTASSEASWNSQTGLLANPPGSIGVSVRNLNLPSGDIKRRGSPARKWNFGRKCCCTGKKSVQIKEIASDSDHGGPVLINNENCNKSVKSSYFYTKSDTSRTIMTPTNLSRRSTSITNCVLEIHQHKAMAMPPNPVRLSPENSFQTPDSPQRQQRVSASGGFSFPILNPNSQTTKRVIMAKPVINPLEDPPRDSLEVFQPMHDHPSRPPSLDNPMARDEDICSDASSDLFEIESFSTQTTSYPPLYRRRDSLDEASTFNPRRFATANGLNLNSITNSRRSLDEPPTPSVAATECYAPSEVSIDWSVTTAEGFDKASVSNFSLSASEFGTAALFRRRNHDDSQGVDGGKKKSNGGGGGGLLLMSCRHEKAVSVGPQPVKFTPSEGPLQVGSRPPRATKPPMGSSHAARLSLAFAA
ncbi:protein PHYTOCHROME KINASE SUBSTRATE 4-like [Andrographis paniculata]|uniref:protein PHYTOCHROME KINASE SUBSTRATE 4-like n=1 Tax=Andrographis paniculata TaxID=175694 RepID=UPI0021E914C7|nr:protein PHYTOCHROME KINASE SUBSTRATE 4-like [Andrographis paniculata]